MVDKHCLLRMGLHAAGESRNCLLLLVCEKPVNRVEFVALV